MTATIQPERIQTVVIGAGQAGLSTGYHLSRRGLPFVILDANERIGDQWRRRWDSLKLFTPARYDGIAGLPFPGSRHVFPAKDEMADYLEGYARHFDLPVRSGVRVDRLWREGDRFLIAAGEQRIEAENVVVAMANYQHPKLPPFAGELDPSIVQFHSIDYRGPSQLKDGPVLLVGAGNSGSEIAMELSRSHDVWMSGRDTGHIPFRIDSFLARAVLFRLVLRGLFYRVFTTSTPIGRKLRPRVLRGGGPLIRVKPGDLQAAGVQRVPRTVGVSDGKPVLEDGRVLDVTNIIWCTGFQPGFSWIDIPVFGEREPLHRRGVVESAPGLYFVGLDFLYAFSSTMIHGVGRDAGYVVRDLATRVEATRAATEPAVAVPSAPPPPA